MKRTILVTGGNRGIGKAICEGLAKMDLTVILGCRDIDQGKVIASEMPGNVTAAELDLSDPGQMERQVSSILDDFPCIDGLINNAAVLIEGDGLELDPKDMLTSLNINLLAPLKLTQLLLPGMVSRNYGRVVNLSSGWGSFSAGLGGPTAYAVSKAALNALTVKLDQTTPDFIKINCVCPGWVRTDMGGAQADRSPEKGAETALWLATLSEDGATGGFFRDKQPVSW